MVGAKTEGVTPGFTMKDIKGRRYVVKFDPLANLELASAADVICSKFLHALGYHVPENYIVYFDRDRIAISPDATFVDSTGKERKMKNRDIEELLIRVPRDPKKGYRGVASHYLTGKPLGPFLYYGTRKDDPNDIVPHEHRRDLRGLFVFAAWLGHNDIKSLNSLDTLLEENGVRYLKHHLLDFGASLGSDSFTTKSPRAGYEYLFAWKPMLKNLLGMGFYVPRWARAHYPNFPSCGNFEYEVFEPEKWKPNYPIPAFENRLPDDTFWAAKQVMRFTEKEIRAIVKTGQYTDPEAEAWMVKCLTKRRHKIGKSYLAKILPLEGFKVVKGKLTFEDLEIRHDFRASRDYSVQWSLFNNDTEAHTPISDISGLSLPESALRAAAGSYFAARIVGEDETRTVTVFLRRETAGFKVVGIDRTW